jgi:hypothetical protein
MSPTATASSGRGPLIHGGPTPAAPAASTSTATPTPTPALLLDTLIVRSVLVTALNLDVGRWIWWPSSLHRKRDVELGELEEEAAAVTR